MSGQLSELAGEGFAWPPQGRKVNLCSCRGGRTQNELTFRSPPARKYRKKTIFDSIVFTGLAARFLQRVTARKRCSDTYYTATALTLQVYHLSLLRSPFL